MKFAFGSLTVNAPSLWRAVRDVGERGGPDGAAAKRWGIARAALAAGGVVIASRTIFGVPIVTSCAALLLAAPLAGACARAAGQTDIMPLGALGQLAQGILGLLPHLQ